MINYLFTNLFYFLLIVNQGVEFNARVVSVSDGDTITVLKDDNTSYKIRFNGIDCPEKSQDYGQKAKQFTSEAIFNKVIKIHLYNQDKYGRWIGDVYTPDGELLNLNLVKAGMAWHYKQYSKDITLANAEIQAREQKRGLWAGSNPQPPWEYRRNQ